jgi:hypothetical protein
MKKASITLGVQAGDVASDEATSPAFMSLRRSLAHHCMDTYCHVIDEFAIVLRISGSIWKFEGEGVQKVRINRKGMYITADLVIPENRWQELSIAEFKKYLSKGVEQTIKAMCDRLEQLKISFDAERLNSDVSKAIASFVNASPSGTVGYGP